MDVIVIEGVRCGCCTGPDGIRGGTVLITSVEGRGPTVTALGELDADL